MKKNDFMYNSIVLIVSSTIVKLLGLINKIFIIRLLGQEGISMYSMIFPTIILFVSIAQFGLPVVVSKFVSMNRANTKFSNRDLIHKSVKISLIVSISICIVFLLSISLLVRLLNDDRLYYPLMFSVILIPLASLTGVLKGYFNGLKSIDISAKSNLVEQIIRIIALISVSYMLLSQNIEIAVSGTIIAISIGEFSALVYLLYKVRNNTNIFGRAKIKMNTNKDILLLALPTTASRIIGSLSYFIEPILYTQLLLKQSINDQFIKNSYADINGFAIPLLLFPHFISHSVATTQIPIISENYQLKRYDIIHKTLDKSITMSLVTGLFVSMYLFYFAEDVMKLLFNSTNGYQYVRMLSPFFIFLYVQTPLTTCLQAMNKATEATITTFISGLIKLGTIYLLISNFYLTQYSLIIAMIINVMIVTSLHYRTTYKEIKYTFNKSIAKKILILSIVTLLLINVLSNNINNYIVVLVICGFEYICLLIALRIIDINRFSLKFER